MTGTLQTDPGMKRGVVMQGEPGFVGQGDDSRLDERKVALNLRLIAADAQSKHNRQELGRGFTAEDRAAESGREQIRNAADMVDVHMRDDQRPDA